MSEELPATVSGDPANDLECLISVATACGAKEDLAWVWQQFPEPDRAPGNASDPDTTNSFWVGLGKIVTAPTAVPEADRAIRILERVAGEKIRSVITLRMVQRHLEGVPAVLKRLADVLGSPVYLFMLSDVYRSMGDDGSDRKAIEEAIYKGTIVRSGITDPAALPGLIHQSDAYPHRPSIDVRVMDGSEEVVFSRVLKPNIPRPYLAEISDAVVEDMTLVHLPGGGVLVDGLSYRSAYGVKGRGLSISSEDRQVLHAPLEARSTQPSIPFATMLGKTHEHGHFIIEGLERLYAHAVANRPAKPPFLVTAPPRPSYRRALSALGLGGGDGDYAIAPSGRVMVETFHIGGIGTGLPSVHPEVTRHLHALGLAAAGVPRNREPRGRRLYLRRGDRLPRRIANEQQIMPMLEAAGYETVHLEELDFIDQIKLISEASEIVGVHGSAMINLIWARPGTRVGIFVPDAWKLWRSSHVEMLCGFLEAVGADASLILGRVANPKGNLTQELEFHQPLLVSPVGLRTWLKG